MAKIRLHVEATPAVERTIELPTDWDEMDETERQDFVLEEARDLMEKTVKFGGEVVN